MIEIVSEKRNLLAFDEKAIDTTGADILYQKCVTIQDFVKSLEGRIASYATGTASALLKGLAMAMPST